MIVIVSTSGDLHALAITREFLRRKRTDCALFAIDKIHNTHGISVKFSYEKPEFRLHIEDRSIRSGDLRSVWWRRPFTKQANSGSLGATEQTFVDEQCRAAYWDAFLSAFKGKWVSTPEATLRASNKILQLDVAQVAGFRVPKTIVSQSRAEVLSFYECCNHQTIVKSLVGNRSPILLTRRLENPASFDEAAYSACPSIYQEMIHGRRHMRLACFGHHAFAAAIESSELDWRPNLDVPVYAYDVPPDIRDKAIHVLRLLGLEMGIFDLKESPNGEWVWLEVNPQGQFLFLEPLTKLPLAEYFTDYLIECATGVSS